MENNNQLSNQISKFRKTVTFYDKYAWILYLAIALICLIITATMNVAEAYGESVKFKDVFDMLKDKSLSFDKKDVNTIKTLRTVYVLTWIITIEGFVVGALSFMNYKKGKGNPLKYTICYGVQLFVMSLIMSIYHAKWSADFYLSKESCDANWLIFLLFAAIYIVLPIVYIFLNKAINQLELFKQKQEADAAKNESK